MENQIQIDKIDRELLALRAASAQAIFCQLAEVPASRGANSMSRMAR